MRDAAVAAAAALDHLEQLVGSASSGTLEPAEDRQSGKRRAVLRLCIQDQPGRPVGLALDMRSDLPIAPVLLMRGLDFLLIARLAL